MAMILQKSRLRLTQAIFFGKPQAAVGSGFIKADGSVPLTADWNAGNFNINSRNSISVFNVVAFGADVTGTGDSSVAIVAAIVACEAAGGGVVYFPPGTYKVVQVGAVVPFVITAGNVSIWGAGRGVANIDFVPATGGAVFQFNTSGVPINYNRVTDISFRSADTTTQKTMVKVRDCNNFIIERVSNTPGIAWTGGAGTGSIGIHFMGRQELRERDCEISADQPIFIDVNPNHPISFDHSSVEDSDLLPTGTAISPSTYHNPAIRIADGNLIITNAAFRQLACVGGNGAILWNATTSPSSSFGIDIDNIRTEQQDTGGGHTTEYDVDIQSNQALQGLSISNLISSGTINGVRLTNAKWTHVDHFSYAGTGVFLNLSATVSNFLIESSFRQTGSTIVDASTNPVAIDLITGGNPGVSSFGTLSPTAATPLNVGSTSQMKVNSTGQISLGGAVADQDLTLSSLSQVHFTGGNTGIYSEPLAPGATTLNLMALASGAAGYLANGASMRLESDAVNSGTIRFATTESGVGNFERVTIDKQGHVGISTTIPTRTLDLNGVQRYRGQAAPAVSEGNSGTIYFDSATNKLMASLNGGPYTPIIGSGGLTGSGTINQLTYWDATTDVAGDPNLVRGGGFALSMNGDLNFVSTANVIKFNGFQTFATIPGTGSLIVGDGAGLGPIGPLSVAIGSSSLANATGTSNTAVGSAAGNAVTAGTGNTAIGQNALKFTTGNANVSLGSASGVTNTTGSNNIFIGEGADASVGNLNHACAIGTGASIADSNALNIGGGIQKVGIATSTPKVALDVNGGVANRQVTVTLVNGLNSDITPLVQSSWLRIEGPSGGFSIGGFHIPTAGVSDGMIVAVYNSTTQQMTIVDEDLSSTAIQRIKTLTGGNVVLRAGTSAATFRYDSTDDRFILMSSN